MHCAIPLHLSETLDCFGDPTMFFENITKYAVNSELWDLVLRQEDYINIQR